MAYEFIDPKDAPPAPPKPGSGRAQEFIELIESLPKNKVAKITPESDQSIRGIKVSVGRIANKRDIKIRSWDDQEFVYVKREA